MIRRTADTFERACSEAQRRTRLAPPQARWQGTHRGTYFGLAPTGRTVEMTGIVIWRWLTVTSSSDGPYSTTTLRADQHRLTGMAPKRGCTSRNSDT